MERGNFEMAVDVQKLYASGITRKAKELAEVLGIKFEVICSIKNHMQDVLVRIEKNHPTPNEDTTWDELESYKNYSNKLNQFTDHITNIVIDGGYANDVRFSYPSKLTPMKVK